MEGELAVTVEKILNYGIWIAGIALGLFLFPFVFGAVAPFILAFLVAAPCQRIVGALERRMKISRGISSAAISTLVVVAALGIITFLAFQLFSQTKNLLQTLPAVIDSLTGQLSGWAEGLQGYKQTLPESVADVIDEVVLNVRTSAKELSGNLASVALSAAGDFAAVLPSAALFFMMFVLGTFFFTKDYILIINFLKEAFPKKVIKVMTKGKEFITNAFSSYLKAQLILMSLTAVLVTVSLWIIGFEYPLLWGILSGLVDALPFLGTAVVLVPLALFSLAYGNYYYFIGLIAIQVLVFLFRQLMEPRVVSRQIGIHPILTLVGVYAGLRFFGVAGMIFAPVVMLLLVNVYVSAKERK